MKKKNKKDTPAQESPNLPAEASVSLCLLAEIALLCWALGLIGYFYYKSGYFYLLRDLWNMAVS
tara:strand:+ start:2602 stop:2793 length:192 start_codon:yes stop_codon:yes gene_type:complete